MRESFISSLSKSEHNWRMSQEVIILLVTDKKNHALPSTANHHNTSLSRNMFPRQSMRNNSS